jgi:hypothetical protein
LSLIKRIKGASKAIIVLKGELLYFETTLRLLKSVEQAEWDFLGGYVKGQVKLALDTCSSTYTVFQASLQH